MRRARGLPLALLLLAWAHGATAGEVRRGLSAPSAALGRAIPYTLYLPDGYGASGRRYPVLYLLHGHGGTEHDWADGGGLAATLDRLIATGAAPPMLVVMPGMGNGWYVDNPDPGGLGAMETAFLADLLPHVDRAWRTDARREARAVAGLSMGGWGAIRFAMLRPDLFAAGGQPVGRADRRGPGGDAGVGGLVLRRIRDTRRPRPLPSRLAVQPDPGLPGGGAQAGTLPRLWRRRRSGPRGGHAPVLPRPAARRACRRSCGSPTAGTTGAYGPASSTRCSASWPRRSRAGPEPC